MDTFAWLSQVELSFMGNSIRDGRVALWLWLLEGLLHQCVGFRPVTDWFSRLARGFTKVRCTDDS